MKDVKPRKPLAARIMDGLNDALRYAEGKPASEGAVHVDASIDAKAIRAKTGLSQSEFAKRCGVSIDTLQNWEQGRKEPTGPARVLLSMLARNPNVVQQTLGENARSVGVYKFRPAEMAKLHASKGEFVGVRLNPKGEAVLVPKTENRASVKKRA